MNIPGIEKALERTRQGVDCVAELAIAPLRSYGVQPGQAEWRSDIVGECVERDAGLPTRVIDLVLAGDDEGAQHLVDAALASLYTADVEAFEPAPLPSELAALMNAAGHGSSIKQTGEQRAAYLLENARLYDSNERRRLARRLRAQLGAKCPPRGAKVGNDPAPGDSDNALQAHRREIERRAREEKPGQIAGVKAHRKQPMRTMSAKISGTDSHEA